MYAENLFRCLLLTLVLLVASAAVADDPVTNLWINEIHYDNAGADVNEGVEIAGPAGTDLSNYKLYFYNGSDNEVYDTASLSGTIGNSENSFGTKWFPVEGIQNGTPDAIALVYESNIETRVIQFISYEGFLTAEDGPAIGMQSTDIGIKEESTQEIGLSLQLTGKGWNFGDFKWIIATATPGAVSTGQKLNPPRATAIVIR